MNQWWRKPLRRFGLIGLVLAVGVAVVLYATGWVSPLWAWLLSITGVTFAMYGYDKGIADTRQIRVPEGVLLGLGLIGGTVGGVAGMLLFRHKTRKGRFQLFFWLIVVGQLALAVAYFVWLRPQLGG